MRDDCIFCKIIAGEIPSAKVYEDDAVLAFLDIGPVTKGHTLVIPKSHHATIAETPDEVLKSMIVVVRKVAQAQLSGLNAAGINVTQANGKLAHQEVPHIHFHVIPRFVDDGFNWVPGTYDGRDDMEEVAGKIRKGMG